MSAPAAAERLAGWLEDMLGAAHPARAFVAGMDREEFMADARTQQAVAMRVHHV